MAELKFNQVYYIGDLLKLNGKKPLDLQVVSKVDARPIVECLSTIGVHQKIDIPD